MNGRPDHRDVPELSRLVREFIFVYLESPATNTAEAAADPDFHRVLEGLLRLPEPQRALVFMGAWCVDLLDELRGFLEAGNPGSRAPRLLQDFHDDYASRSAAPQPLVAGCFRLLYAVQRRDAVRAHLEARELTESAYGDALSLLAGICLNAANGIANHDPCRDARAVLSARAINDERGLQEGS